MGAYSILSIQVVHELSVLANNISSDQGEFCTVPNIRTTDQNDLGIQSNLPKASFVTNSEPRHNINMDVVQHRGRKRGVLSIKKSRRQAKGESHNKEGHGWVNSGENGA